MHDVADSVLDNICMYMLVIGQFRGGDLLSMLALLLVLLSSLLA